MLVTIQIKKKRLITILPLFFTLLFFSVSSFIPNSEAIEPSARFTEENPPLPAGRFFNPDVLKSTFIVADPRIVDPNFNRTVILILSHGKNGSLGLIVNRPTTTTISELLPDMEEFVQQSDLMLSGGPVSPETLTLLFLSETPPGKADPVFGNVYVSKRARDLANLLMSTVMKKEFRIYAGFSSWAPGQLENEIVRGDWRVVQPDASILFEVSPDIVWEKMFWRSQERSVQNEIPGGAARDPEFF